MGQMKPTQRMIQTEIKRLRVIIDNSSESSKKDLILSLIAYEVECVLRWSTEYTKGWQKPSASVLDASQLLTTELNNLNIRIGQ